MAAPLRWTVSSRTPPPSSASSSAFLPLEIPYWDHLTVEGVGARYPNMDMGPYRAFDQ